MKHNIYRKLFDFMEERKFKYVCSIFFTLLYGCVFNLFYSYMYKSIFDAVEYRNWELFLTSCVMCAGIVIVCYFSPYLGLWRIRQVRITVFNVKIQMFKKLLHMKMQYFEEHHSGDTLKRLNWDANCLKDLYLAGVVDVLDSMTTGIVSIIAMVLYSWKLAMVSILFSVATVGISMWINRIVSRQSREIQRNLARLSERLSDVLSGFLILKMYQGSRIVLEEYDKENQSARRTTVKRAKVLSAMEMISFLAGMLGSFGTIAVGIWLVMKGEINYGTIMAIVTLQMSISVRFQNFGTAMARFVSLMAGAERVIEFLEQTEDEDWTTGKIPYDSHAGIEIKDVTFAYQSNAARSNAVQNSAAVRNSNAEDCKENVLNHLSMKIEDGERVMLVGESGCGKSTLLKLLMRFYDKSEGTIELLGNEIMDYSLEQLRDMITYVPQSSYLFAGTIEENIHYSNPNATREEVLQAAQMAYAKEFIDRLPDGFETMLEAGGTNLSGGQRQRVAIARAFLKNAPIILLDEPSSALDVESEGMIQMAMNQLMKDKIVLMVTHRTTSFSEFDRIIRVGT